VNEETTGLTISADGVKLLKDLLLRFVDDVQRKMPPKDAGWVKRVDAVTRELARLGLCVIGDQGVRVCAPVSTRRDIETLLDDEGKDLFAIYIDISKAAELEQVVSKIVNSPAKASVCSVGLERMLQNSEFPIAPELALQQGIEPDEWQIRVSNAIPGLAMILAKKLWNIESWSDVLALLNQSQLPAPKITQNRDDWFERVKGILKWDKVVSAIDEELARALGLLWYADDLLAANEIDAPEGIILVQRKTWSIVEQDLGRNSEEIKREIEEMTERIDGETREEDKQYGTRPIASWVDIIRMPW